MPTVQSLPVSRPAPPGTTPFVFRGLCVSRAEPRWSSFSVRLQAALQRDVRLDWIDSPQELLRHLQTAGCDVVIFEDLLTAGLSNSGDDGFDLDAVATVLGGVPYVALSALPCDHWAGAVTDAGGLVCVSPRLWDSPALPGFVIAAVRRGQQQTEWRQLRTEQQRRKVLDLADARALLQLQQESLRRIRLQSGSERTTASEDNGWQRRYAELLRASLVTSLSGVQLEIGGLVADLFAAGIGPLAVLQTHLVEAERLLDGLGARSSRQVASRATLLAVNVVAELGERYRKHAGAAVAGLP